MANVRTQMMDDEEVGKGSGDFFKPEKIKQRFALIPAFVPDTELTVSPEEQASVEPSVAEQVQSKMQMLQGLQDGLSKEPATVIRSQMDGSDGFLFARVDSHYVHYLKSIGYFLCKKADYEAQARSATCCLKCDKDPQLMFAMVVLRYDTDMEGNLNMLPAQFQTPLDQAGNKMDFKFAMMRWTLSDSRMRQWKRYHGEFPPISSDFHVWMEKQGNSDRIMFAPCRDQALWLRRGPVLVNNILIEAAKMWPKAAFGLGRDMPLDEVDQVFGVTSPTQKAAHESNFTGLLGAQAPPAAIQQPAAAPPAAAAPAPAPAAVAPAPPPPMGVQPPAAAAPAAAAPAPTPPPEVTAPAPAPEVTAPAAAPPPVVEAPAPAPAPTPQAPPPPPPLGT